MYYFSDCLVFIFYYHRWERQFKFIAEKASKGLNQHEKEKVKQWFKSPDFLYQPAETWELNQGVSFLKTGDTEIDRFVSAVIQDDIVASFENISSWEKMKRVMNLVLKFNEK